MIYNSLYPIILKSFRNKKIGLLIYVFFASNLILFAQKEGNNWYFGNKAGVTFNTSPPSALTNGQLNTYEGCATMSNAKGRLLFYTDGISVWDSTHNVMSNGSGLKGNSSSTQSGIIVPRPDSAHIFYIFTVDDQAGTDGLRYSELNMKLNSGKGDIVSTRKNILLKTPVCEKITSVLHSNGKDYWVLAAKYGNDSFFSYKVTSAGVNNTPIGYKTGFKISGNSAYTLGYLKISPDGKKVGYTNYILDSAVIGDFDASTGIISNIWRFKCDDGYGLEFSPKSKFLYVTEFSLNKVAQYDLTTNTRASFIASKKVIDSNYSSSPGSLQVGPDGKIYLSVYNSGYLSVIHAPDSSKFSCRPQKNYISLSGKSCQFGLPTFIQSIFHTKSFTFVRNCVNDTTEFKITDSYNIDSLKWNFDDVSSGSENFSNKTTKVYHVFKKVGFYNVKLYSYFKNKIDSFVVKVFIKNPKPKLGRDTALCNNISYIVKPHKLYSSYLWSNSATTPSINVTQKGTYILKAKDSVGCYSSDTIEIKNPKVNSKFSVSDTLLCFKNNSISLKDLSTYTDDSYKKTTFNLGDGNTVVDTAIIYQFNNADTFKIKIINLSQNNCKDSTTKTVIILPNTNIGFNINKDKQCFNGHQFVLTNTSTITNDSSSYLWSFGDDSTSNLFSINNKIYLKDSNYNVQLISSTKSNCKDTLIKSISIYPNSKINFNASPLAQCFNYNNLNIKNNSQVSKGIINSFKWNLGDGTFLYNRDISNKHYSYPDSFTIELLTITDRGCRDSSKSSVIIHPNTKINFSINDSTQCLKINNLNFNNSSTISKGNYTSNWNLGDNNFSTSNSINNKVYSIDSTYIVKLITISDKNCKDTLSKSVHVNSEPKTLFSVNQTIQCVNGNSFNFTNNTKIKNGNIATNKWLLGDNTFSSSINVINKSYSTDDTFKVKLISISNFGCIDSNEMTVVTNPSTFLKYNINFINQCFNEHQIDIKNLSSITKGTYNYFWELGDNSTETSLDIINKKYSTFGKYTVKLISITNNNCKDTLSKIITINESPKSKFTIDKSKQCFRGNVFNFVNQSTYVQDPIAVYYWDLGNGFTSNSTSILNYNYNTEDTFNVRLIAQSSKNCFDTSYSTAITFAHPVAKFTVPNDSQCWQKNFFVINNNTTLKYGTLNNSWDFGDATYSSDFTPTNKRYPNTSGSYIIKYKTVSDNGCADSAQKRVALLERPISEFDINDSIQCYRGHLFNFNNKTTFSAMYSLRYWWDYNNGDTSIGINPKSATYANPGLYNVRLISYSYLTNCYDTIFKQVIPAPHAQVNFNINKDSQCLRFNDFILNNTSNVQFGSNKYLWNFGDNNIDTNTNTNHHYLTENAYTIKLVATTNYDCKDSISKSVGFYATPKASFVVNDSTQCLNKHQFNWQNTSSISRGSYQSYWYFSDNSSSNVKDLINKTFNSPLYTNYYLSVLSDKGCSDTSFARLYLEKQGNLSINLTQNDSQCLRGNQFDFNTINNNTSVNILNSHWVFGDGQESFSNVPATQSFLTDGNYKVLLSAQSAVGCYDSAYSDVVVHPHPVSDFSTNDVCFPEPVNFTNNSTIKTGSISQTKWHFGDGKVSFVNSPTYVYKNDGIYSIALISTSQYGCVDSIFKSNKVVVKEKPKANFSFSKLPTTVLEQTRLQFKQTASSDVTRFNWDFGNSTYSQDADPIGLYDDTGRYNVTQIVWNANNCSDTITKNTGLLLPDFFINIPNAFSPDKNGINEMFLPIASKYVREYTFEIYNRWGELLYKTNDIRQGWDGTYKGEKCMEGVYMYKIYVIPMNGAKRALKGSITLLK